MQLTLHADYALRVLLYLGTHPDRVIPTSEIGTAYGISRNHLVRVVQTLAADGYVNVVPGRMGGIKLSRQPQAINLGAVVRSAEVNLKVVECFDPKTNTCVIAPVCGLKGVLQSALNGFLSVLDRYTLADVLLESSTKQMARLFARRMKSSSEIPADS